MSADLLPCPFCGGSVALERATDTYSEIHGRRQWWGVVCRNTINLGGTCCIEQVPSASTEAAVERWNRRAALSAKTEGVDCCDTPNYCSSVRRCTAQDAAPMLNDRKIADTVNELRDIAIQFHAAGQLRERIAGVVVPLLKAVPAMAVQPVAVAWMIEANVAPNTRCITSLHQTEAEADRWEHAAQARHSGADRVKVALGRIVPAATVTVDCLKGVPPLYPQQKDGETFTATIAPAVPQCVKIGSISFVCATCGADRQKESCKRENEKCILNELNVPPLRSFIDCQLVQQGGEAAQSALRDMLVYGNVITQGGKHVPYEEFYAKPAAAHPLMDGKTMELDIAQLRYRADHNYKIPECTSETLALNVHHSDCHKAADAFWTYWKENGETGKHGYYESTWGAINRAIRMVGVVRHDYGIAATKGVNT